MPAKQYSVFKMAERKIGAEPLSPGIPIVSSETLTGYKIKEVKGLVWASTVRAKSIFDDVKALLKLIVGGEIKEFWQLINEARHDIMVRLNKNAMDMGANAVVSVRIESAEVIGGAIEIYAYGTAVVVEKV